MSASMPPQPQDANARMAEAMALLAAAEVKRAHTRPGLARRMLPLAVGLAAGGAAALLANLR